ncbi:benzoate 4-monooxygenase cytochrome P450 [Metarhizium acridum CQMa 102]|uniref:Benzoate 4-monooxygenase cytochrome P450 n=2 Tax=Metarhizium acridum TaxID=92637 RepID=E9DUX8_METAQ|nr:benzoate 4-monooxygenase cytochrome P450 [Metarhizium acridum CQMa 102]EFY92545.1 benzoate 4-monooxygenase cytochrome P450 [Metarhizium acridum CQMa 102]
MLIVVLLPAVVATWVLARALYLVYVHPLAIYPGPLLAKLTDIYYAYYAWRGDIHLKIWEDHQKYEHKTPSSFTSRDRKDHLRRRRIVSQTVSEKAQRGYEDRIKVHVNKLCDILYQETLAAGQWSASLDMGRWCNWLTFDVMSDVVFSAYYNLLGSERFRYVPEAISKSNVRMSVLVIIPWLSSFNMDRYFFRDAIIARYRFLKFVVRCVRERIQRGTKLELSGIQLDEQEPSPDAIEGGTGGDVFEALSSARDSKTGRSFGQEELASESVTLIVAGSETSSTAIASVLFYLADNKFVYDRLAAGVRASSEAAFQSCIYLRACIDEAMRMSPPNGAVLGREVVAPNSLLVDGSRIGAGCNTGVGIYAIHHDGRCYADPFVYRPERWIEDDGSGDSIERARAAFNPFSLGTRSCVGKSLAYHEIAITIGTILRRGDFRFAAGELGRIGRGKQGAAASCRGRQPENEYQLREHIAGQKNGPWLEFLPLSR